jgi:glycosyltransferase involved in cell wall biosynthesis
MNQTLSIAIPTYKRATCLAQTLDAFIDQVRPYDVPICVSYNDDTDATEKVIAKAREKYPYIVATSNSAVTGIDRNICSALALATSRYAWLFGDDDIPKPGAVETLLSHLHQGDYGMVVVNGATFNNNFSRLVEPQRVRASADRIYLPGEHERLLAETASYITFLGGLVVRKDLWDSVSATPFLESDYVHVAVAYRYIVGHRALLIAKPLINIRLGGATWGKKTW